VASPRELTGLLVTGHSSTLTFETVEGATALLRRFKGLIPRVGGKMVALGFRFVAANAAPRQLLLLDYHKRDFGFITKMLARVKPLRVIHRGMCDT
jgi:hypothetical protein